ncbi:hypothetical protein AB0391_01820 [Streptomyces albidoflavus]|uniref:hypothetical protein n=1 Tax=Streptomyces albidoflavus TaxID=1886 RepID=UPI00344B0300
MPEGIRSPKITSRAIAYSDVAIPASRRVRARVDRRLCRRVPSSPRDPGRRPAVLRGPNSSSGLEERPRADGSGPWPLSTKTSRTGTASADARAPCPFRAASLRRARS